MREKDVWTVRELATWCGVSVRTVLNWIERGTITSYKLPGRGDNRFRMDDVVAFLRENGMPLPERADSAGRRVLIVDDDPTAVKIAVKALKLQGYEIVTASDGFAAGAQLGAFRPQLAILDLRMPGLSGHEVIKLMKSTPQYEGVKILVVSSMPREELEKARRAGADDVLQKPVVYTELQEKAASLLGVKPGTRA